MAAKSEAVDVEDRVHVHETVVPGPHGQQLATLSIDEDIQEVRPPPPPPYQVPPPPPPPGVPATPIRPPPLRLPPPGTNPRGPHDAIIIAVFASLGGLLLLAFFAAAVTCYIRKRKKKMAAKRQAVDVEDQVGVNEAAVQGPHRRQPAAPTSIDDDIEIHELMEEGEVIGETSSREPARDAVFERRGRQR
ncbi:hypothetical protein MUK42_18944 [Musa troglodytarum]|uniref:Uncharacterized protein n=1 Tax=Musa troglodytarum TaxID=320322 RepID=A0A9E7K5R3_9LILI|nr:hypothetical protein MUK42_18944 [Musa troglodytarum]